MYSDSPVAIAEIGTAPTVGNLLEWADEVSRSVYACERAWEQLYFGSEKPIADAAEKVQLPSERLRIGIDRMQSSVERLRMLAMAIAGAS